MKRIPRKEKKCGRRPPEDTKSEDEQPLGERSEPKVLQKASHAEQGNLMTLQDVNHLLKDMEEIQVELEELKVQQREGEAKLKALQVESEERLRALQLEMEKEHQSIEEKSSSLMENKEKTDPGEKGGVLAPQLKANRSALKCSSG
jgi:hypothetical protein